MKCFRCNKELEHPDNSNADYIMAEDTKANDLVTVLRVVTEDPKDSAKEVKAEIKNVEEVAGLPIKRIEVTREVRLIQKTGIICNDCYQPTDFVIWGIHKKV